MPGSTTETAERKKTLLFTAGSLLYFFAQWLMTVIIVKTSGFELAGLLSLAMSVTSAPAIVALFNVRTYQISDIKGKFSNKAYIVSRVFTCFAAFAVCLIVSLLNHYSAEKIQAILSFMLFKLVESFADVYAGIEQKNNRLDLAGISLLIRGICTVAVFYAVLLISGNLTLANVAIAFSSVIVVALIDFHFYSGLPFHEEESLSASVKAASKLLLVCLPLAIVGFLNNFSFSIPKLILEQNHGQTILGIYNSLSSPTLVIQLVAATFFAPFIPELANLYSEGDKAGFTRRAFRFAKIAAVLSAVCMIGVVVLHWTGLLKMLFVFMYAEDIGSYVGWFLPVCVLSMLIAMNACLFNICTLMRMMKIQLAIGAVGIVSSFAFSWLLIPGSAVSGTIYALIATALCQILVQAIIIGHGYRNHSWTQ